VALSALYRAWLTAVDLRGGQLAGPALPVITLAVWGWVNISDGNIWIHEVARAGSTLLTKYEGMDIQPVWSPDGSRVAFTSARTGGADFKNERDLYVKSVDRNEPAELLLSGGKTFALDWSNGDRYLLLLRLLDGEEATGLWYLDLRDDKEYEAKPVRAGILNAAAFSPDGRYVTFTSNHTGSPQVYVCSFPDCHGERQVSFDGGMHARWAKGQGGSIYYVAPNDTMMEVKVRTRSELFVGPPIKLFTFAGLYGGPTSVNRPYDVFDDGRHFVIVKRSKLSTEKPPAIHVWQNWSARFSDRQVD
jgi:Tol biopolymer transport system component